MLEEDTINTIYSRGAITKYHFSGKCVIYPQPRISIDNLGQLESKGRVGNVVIFTKEDLDNLCSLLPTVDSVKLDCADVLVTSNESLDKSTKKVIKATNLNKRIIYYEDFLVHVFNLFDFSKLYEYDSKNKDLEYHQSHFMYKYIEENYPELKSKIIDAHFNLMNRTNNPFAYERHILELYDGAFNAGKLSDKHDPVLYDHMSWETKNKINYIEPRIVIGEDELSIRFPCGTSKKYFLTPDNQGRLTYSTINSCSLANLEVPIELTDEQNKIEVLAKELNLSVIYIQTSAIKSHNYQRLPYFSVMDSNEECSIFFDLISVGKYLANLKTIKTREGSPNKRVISI